MNTKPKAIEVIGVSKNYVVNHETFPALKTISFTVNQGEICGVIGKSGAGKSTLLRCLNGLESIDSGSIVIEGQNFSNSTKEIKRSLQKKIGTVYQGFNLLSRRTVLQNIALPLEFSGETEDSITTKVQALATLVGLGDKGENFPSQLSGGQRQRVAIARALVGEVSFLLCDEFTSALDPETSLEVLSLLKKLNSEMGVTIVLITHDMSVVREICDTVCVLDQGGIVESGTVESILLYPQHEVTQGLVRSLFVRDLPNPLLEKLSNESFGAQQVLLRLFFAGESAQQPVIATLVQKYNLPINIISGSLDHIRETAFGALVVILPYAPAVLSGVITDLSNYGISVDIIGYMGH
jgi:D-methionine transport system ATP-binding protein